MNEPHYITLQKEDEKYASTYTAHFPSPISYVSGIFEVGLKEAIITMDPGDIDLKKTNYMAICNGNDLVENQILSIPRFPRPLLFDHINKTLKAWMSPVRDLRIEARSGHCVITTGDINICLLFTKELADALGFNIHLSGETKETIKPPSARQIALFRSVWVKEAEDIDSSPSTQGEGFIFAANYLRKTTDCLFVHSDIIKHHFVGSDYKQLLKIIPVVDKNFIYQSIERPVFRRLFSETFDKIKVEFKDSDGNPHHVRKAILVLEFKRAEHEQSL